MYVRVDVDAITGFSYSNQDGNTEVVEVDNPGVVRIKVDSTKVDIYTHDVPKLLTALKAAYEHKSGDTL